MLLKTKAFILNRIILVRIIVLVFFFTSVGCWIEWEKSSIFFFHCFFIFFYFRILLSFFWFNCVCVLPKYKYIYIYIFGNSWTLELFFLLCSVLFCLFTSSWLCTFVVLIKNILQFEDEKKKETISDYNGISLSLSLCLLGLSNKFSIVVIFYATTTSTTQVLVVIYVCCCWKKFQVLNWVSFFHHTLHTHTHTHTYIYINDANLNFLFLYFICLFICFSSTCARVLILTYE